MVSPMFLNHWFQFIQAIFRLFWTQMWPFALQGTHWGATSILNPAEVLCSSPQRASHLWCRMMRCHKLNIRGWLYDVSVRDLNVNSFGRCESSSHCSHCSLSMIKSPLQCSVLSSFQPRPAKLVGWPQVIGVVWISEFHYLIPMTTQDNYRGLPQS